MEYILPISTLITKLESDFFHENWLKVPSGISADTYKDVLVNNIINASTEIFKYYTLLILSGEYCRLSDKDNESLSIRDLEIFLEKVSSQIEIKENGEIQLELQSRFFDNILHPLKHTIKLHIDYLARDLRVQFDLEHKRQLFRGDKIGEKQHDTDQDVLAYSRAFEHTIYFTRIEHFRYHQNENVVKDLLFLEKEVSELLIKDENLKSAILVKLNFLLKKILYRIKTTSADGAAELIYSFDQQADRELSVDGISIDESLTKWDGLIKTHYGFTSNFKSEQRKRVQSIYEKLQANYCYKDFHGLIKIYKDDTKNKEQTSNLLTEFSKKPVLSSLRLDEYARKVTYSYLFNNDVSLQCENSKITYQQCVDLYDGIRNHQNINNVRNYFPWEKLAKTIGIKIEALLNNLVDKEKYKQFKIFLALYSKTLGKFEETLKWSRFKSFLPIQMPFGECQSDYEITIDGYPKVKLFFFSSFLLPLNYGQTSRSKDELQLRKLKYDTLDSVYDKLQYVVEDVNESSAKMRNQERRSVEILAIFSAVALFSIGSIQIFSQKEVAYDPHVYYRFIMAFGYSLCLFVLLIWIITRDNIKQVHIFHWIIVILVFISSCFAIGYFIGDPIFGLITDKNK
ncbi:hypothetical protein [Parapedobacter sp. DT-150]|uniref:hypothetical protein n=1 Tax=Parapedobacter sp. DT-150 TaxID=3396162 RepID=UPI003F1C81F7